MRNFAKYLPSLLILGGAFLGQTLSAQLTSRSGATVPVERSSGVTETLPCNGSVLFSEDFESGIPSTWTVFDGDDFTPRSTLGLAKGWQGITDYKDSTDHAAATPSWYSPSGQSDDWLITPAITLGANSCLSWNSYSQDQFFNESYEVRIATTPYTAPFIANPALMTVASEPGTPAFKSVSLLDYAGQTVYIAFRQTSDDKFVLVLDDVQVSNVNTVDVGAFAVTSPSIALEDTVAITFEVANYGSDTITSFLAVYQIDGMPAQSMSVGAVSLPPNQTVTFSHDSLFISGTVDENVNICAWTNLPNSTFDLDQSNDSTCSTLTVGNPVGRPDPSELSPEMTIYPNPFGNTLNIELDGVQQSQSGMLRMIDPQGRVVFEQEMMLRNHTLELELPEMSSGLYILEISSANQRITRKLMHH